MIRLPGAFSDAMAYKLFCHAPVVKFTSGSISMPLKNGSMHVNVSMIDCMIPVSDVSSLIFKDASFMTGNALCQLP